MQGSQPAPPPRQAGGAGNYSPTATAAQRPTQMSQNPTEQMRLQEATGSAPPPPPQNTGGGNDTLANVNQAAQLGLTLQQIAQMNSGAGARSQALAGAPRGGGGFQFTPTAGSNQAIIGQDPRIQSLLTQQMPGMLGRYA